MSEASDTEAWSADARKSMFSLVSSSSSQLKAQCREIAWAPGPPGRLASSGLSHHFSGLAAGGGAYPVPLHLAAAKSGGERGCLASTSGVARHRATASWTSLWHCGEANQAHLGIDLGKRPAALHLQPHRATDSRTRTSEALQSTSL